MHYKNHNSAKKETKKNENENVVPFQNDGQKTDFYSASFRFWSQFETTFPKEFFNEISLKVGEHE